MQKLLPMVLTASAIVAAVLTTDAGGRRAVQPTAAAKSGSPATYSLNAVSPGATGAWTFFTASAGDQNYKNYLSIVPVIDAANTVRIVAEPNVPWRPVLEWEYGYAAGLITVRPESDRNTSIKKGDMIAMWAAPDNGKYEVRIEVDNVGTDALGGDGGTLILSRLPGGKNEDADVVGRVAIPPSGHGSPHVQQVVPFDASAGDRIVMRLNAGIDGYADLWHLRYVIARAEA